MKNFPFLKNAILVVLPIFMLAGIGCNGPDDDQPSSNGTVSQTLTQASGWKIVWYWDKDKDETNNFSGYVFQFKDDGSFTSIRNGTTTTGTWQVTSKDGSQRLVIFSGSAAKPLSDMDDDWVIKKQTSDRIELQDDNTEHLEELFFEKL